MGTTPGQPVAPATAHASAADAPAAAAERRAHERLPCDLAATLTEVSDDQTIGPCSECRVIDVSHGGCCILSPRALAVDQRVLLQVFSAGGRRCLLARVRHVSPDVLRGKHAAGLEFLPPPPSGPVRQWMDARAA